MYQYLRFFLSIFILISSSNSIAQIDEYDLLPNNGASNDVFGSSIAISDNFIVVGAPLKNNGVQSNTGEVYVYEKSGSNWSLQTSLLASDAEPDDRFGSSVAVDDSTIVVGAPFEDDVANISGAVYIFQHDGSNWQEVTKLTDPSLQANDEFGHSVSISGDWLSIGVPKDDDLNTNSGVVWLYEYDGSNWVFNSKLTSNFTEFGEELFGFSVDLEGSTLAVGSTLDDDAATDAGTVFMYDYDGTNWSFMQKLSPSDGGNSFSYGFSLDLDTNQLLVGAYGGNPNLLSAGAAYYYTFDGSSWAEDDILFPDDAAQDDWFGYDVGLDGNTAIMSAINDDDNGTSSGSLYIFRWDQTEWIEEFKVISNDGNNGDEYGYSAALNGFDFAVGAYKRDLSGSNSGKAYAYSLCSYKPEVDLCMATVDSTNNGHWLLYEEPRATLIDSFYVYGNTGSGFQRIETIAYGDTPEAYNGNVDLENDTAEYYLATVNSCGIESDTSEIHKTMSAHSKFIDNGAKVLITWSAYQGYDFDYYRVWRDDNGNGNWQQITSQLDNIFEFVDQNPPSGQNLRYRVEAYNGVNCNLSRGYENALSSVYNPNYATINNQQLAKVSIYPNPVDTYLKIDNVPQTIDYRITDISGKTIKNGVLNEGATQQISVQSLDAGSYLFYGYGADTKEQIVHKFIVQ